MTLATTVLFVEDDELVRAFLEKALELGGFQSRSAADGTDALAQTRAGIPGLAVIVIDGLLPDMHGAELAAAFLEEPATAAVPLCFISGALRQMAPNRAGITALAKPVKAITLLTTVKDLIAWSHGPVPTLQERRDALDELTAAFSRGP